MGYTKEQHKKWLEKQGLSLKDIRKRKPKKSLYKPQTKYAESYYEEKTLDGRPMPKKELDISNESNKVQNEIKRKQEIMQAMNMPGPRDLNYAIGEIPQKYLQSK